MQLHNPVSLCSPIFELTTRFSLFFRYGILTNITSTALYSIHLILLYSILFYTILFYFLLFWSSPTNTQNIHREILFHKNYKIQHQQSFKHTQTTHTFNTILHTHTSTHTIIHPLFLTHTHNRDICNKKRIFKQKKDIKIKTK